VFFADPIYQEFQARRPSAQVKHIQYGDT